MSFSERKGLKAVRQAFQVDSMDDALRSSLWNVLHFRIWDTNGFMWHSSGMGAPGRIINFSKLFWFSYFKKPFSDIPNNPHHILETLQKYFFECQWNEVYDFIEEIISILDDRLLVADLNFVLQRELAGYRVIEGKFSAITDKQEIAALEQALSDDKFGGVSAHLTRALELLSDRKNPDYRNSIKESVSAIESTARMITGQDKATLSEALNILERSKKLHPALKEGFSRIYGYTSDADGIRHAMLEEPDLNATDAKFFLLSCTSFVNYLKSQL